ncbi:hypothetical protein NDU88_001899 [Pleurodeles waltl]|uniref:Reverse transcriptase RNase H-like domain-containing protein n=1 Tax=Pleurodeles waltl TaxID=8319 RepID=A0AAV7T1U0_PLEWA|nr:hypothetical protein NDU88_001899 [Pleurodeles waltl]
MKKGVTYEWDESCKHSFQELKDSILKVPTLGVFDANAKTFLTTDASNVGVAAVLTQVKEGEERIIDFASRRLQGAEASYSVIEREALACCWGINHFKFNLWGLPFKLRTDHKPLTYIFKGGRGLEGGITPRISKWLLSVLSYNFVVQFVKGSKNVVADYLYRVPKSEEELVEDGVKDVIGTVLGELAITAQEWEDAETTDPDLQIVKEKVEE